MASKLSVTSHRADILGLRYVYPVISRRAGGLSIGVNFNTNNTCNWRCVYCQVQNLTVGVAPALDFALLEQELHSVLADVLQSDFYDRFEVAPDKRVIKDIAIAGNGEPTSLAEFPDAIAKIAEVATQQNVFPGSDFVLITNGSLIHQPRVRLGLEELHRQHGQVWFKFDSATEQGRKRINNTAQSVRAALSNLVIASELCTTKLQTCLVDYDGQGLSVIEKSAYLTALASIKNECNVQDIMLYTIARPSMQPEAKLLKPLSYEVLAAFADEIRQLGFDVSVCV